MKHETPEAYAVWLRMVEGREKSEQFLREAPYRVPARIASRGQWFGLAAVIAVLAFAGWAAYLDHPWLAGVIAGFDLVTLVAVFNGSQGPNRRRPRPEERQQE
ncbi:hypothetical protein ACIGKR_29750 [Rhodococcus qingshengii]|uniref:hypothetical protein n=1 Tax=Rhodococcus qingshengii TaxID=334542 RepID=UPI0037CB3689